MPFSLMHKIYGLDGFTMKSGSTIWFSNLNLFLFSQLCELYGCQLSEWVPTCKQFGGPVNVNLEACIQQDSGCEAFKRGHCNFKEENILANIAGNFRAEDCQVTI